MSGPSQLHARIQSKKILLGCSIDSPAPASAELAALIGFDIIWADMEHSGISLLEAQALFQGAKAGGAMTILRVPSATRPHILGALDRGADMIMVPMVESVATARQMVEFGKFKPLGNRGFVGSSRGMIYGLNPPVATMERANQETHLFVQIETMEGVKHCREILAVEGIAGVVVGPADLSVSMGKPMAFDDEEYLKVFCDIIRATVALKKIAVVPSGNPTLVKAALQSGAQILMTAGERAMLRTAWQQNLKEMRAMMPGA
jgi:4-hydroxy-2-oxoheptanedioate aldolase